MDRDPKGGTFWVRDGTAIAIPQINDPVVNVSGQYVLLNLAKFGLTPRDITNFVANVTGDNDAIDAATEWAAFLHRRPPYDPWVIPILKNTAKLTFGLMLQRGWAWVRSAPPAQVHFMVAPDHAKQAMTAAADILPLLSVTRILVTLVTNFRRVHDNESYNALNRTYKFTGKASLGGAFHAVLRWLGHGEVDSSNFYFVLVDAGWRAGGGLMSDNQSVKTPAGYPVRYALSLLAEQPASVPAGQKLLRLPRSATQQPGFKVTPPDAQGRMVLYTVPDKAKRYVVIPPDQIDVLTPDGWVSPR